MGSSDPAILVDSLMGAPGSVAVDVLAWKSIFIDKGGFLLHGLGTFFPIHCSNFHVRLMNGAARVFSLSLYLPLNKSPYG